MPERIYSQARPRGDSQHAGYNSIDISSGSGTTRRIYFRAKTTDVLVIDQIFRQNQYELGKLQRSAELKDFIDRQKKVTGKSPLIVDAGANIGASSVLFAAMVPDAKVVAIEPKSENFKLLELNIEGLRIEAMHAALSSASGLARVVDPEEGYWGYRTESVDGKIEMENTVPRVTIDNIYREDAAQYFPFIVKVDIEGGEVDLFSANTGWVAKTPLLIVELHDWLLTRSANSRTFLKCISTLDRDFLCLGESVYSIANDLWSSP